MVGVVLASQSPAQIHVHIGPCLLILYPLSKPRARRRKTRFRFESMWTRDGRCRDVVEMAWSSTGVSRGNRSIQDRIKECQLQLQWWNRNVFGHVTKKLKEKQDKLQSLENQNTLHEMPTKFPPLGKKLMSY